MKSIIETNRYLFNFLKTIKMKKLTKIEIKPEKLIKNEELLTLRGGYDGPCTCGCRNAITGYIFGYLLSESGDCRTDCRYAFGEWIGNTGVCED